MLSLGLSPPQMNSILLISQLIISMFLILAILMQNRGEGLSGTFGGSGGEFFATRRGAEKLLFQATVVLSILFALNALIFAFWPTISSYFV